MVTRIQTKKPIIVCSAFLSLTTGLLLAHPARADINYTFLQMSCDASSKTAKIKAIYDWNEAGKIRSEKPEKNTYYLDAIGSREDRKYGKQIKCKIAKDQVVSFATHKGELPKLSSLALFINNKRIETHPLGWGEWSIDVAYLNEDKYAFKYCPSFLDHSYQQSGEERKCQISYVIKNKIEKKEIVDAKNDRALIQN